MTVILFLRCFKASILLIFIKVTGDLQQVIVFTTSKYNMVETWRGRRGSTSWRGSPPCGCGWFPGCPSASADCWPARPQTRRLAKKKKNLENRHWVHLPKSMLPFWDHLPSCYWAWCSAQKRGCTCNARDVGCFFFFILLSLWHRNYPQCGSHPSHQPLHLLHQLQQRLLELAADGLRLVLPGDRAALSHVSSSLVPCDLSVNQEEVGNHLDAEERERKKSLFFHSFITGYGKMSD